MQARAGDDHRLGLAADLALHLGGEVLDADPHLLADRVRVQLDEGLEQVLGLLLVVARVVLDLVQEPPVGLVSGVVRQHVEDEPLLDRLAHAVEMEGHELPVGALGAEQLERLRLGRGREGEGGEVGQPSALLHLGQDGALQLLLGRLRSGLPCLRLFQRIGGEHGLEALRALARLRGVRLVHDQGEALARQLVDLLCDHWELLERGHDDRLPRLERLLELPCGLLDVLHHAEGLLELAHGALELAVEHE